MTLENSYRHTFISSILHLNIFQRDNCVFVCVYAARVNSWSYPRLCVRFGLWHFKVLKRFVKKDLFFFYNLTTFSEFTCAAENLTNSWNLRTASWRIICTTGIYSISKDYWYTGAYGCWKVQIRVCCKGHFLNWSWSGRWRWLHTYNIKGAVCFGWAGWPGWLNGSMIPHAVNELPDGK